MDNFIKTKKDPAVVANIIELCKQKDITVQYLSKHDLNMMTDSKPHQGLVLRASALIPIPVNTLPPSSVFRFVYWVDILPTYVYRNC